MHRNNTNSFWCYYEKESLGYTEGLFLIIATLEDGSRIHALAMRGCHVWSPDKATRLLPSFGAAPFLAL